MPSTRTIALSVTAATAAAIVGYGAWFDYQRRNSKDFRRQLKKNAKRHEKDRVAAAEADKSQMKEKVLAVLTESLLKDPIPESLQEREKLFAEEVAKGDELLNAPGEDAKILSALGFYRALYVYPSPVDLLNIYDEKLSQPVLDILRTMLVLQPPPQLLSSLSRAAGASEHDVNSSAAAAAAAAAAAQPAEDVE